MNHGAGTGPVMTPLAGFTRHRTDADRMRRHIVQALFIGPHIANWRRAVGRLAMTGQTSTRVSPGAQVMTVEAAGADTADSIEIGAVAKRTGRLDIAGRIMIGPVRRMGVINPVAGFATVAAHDVDTDIEPWIAAGAPRLPMALLTIYQVGLCVGAVVSAHQVAVRRCW